MRMADLAPLRMSAALQGAPSLRSLLVDLMTLQRLLAICSAPMSILLHSAMMLTALQSKEML